MFHAALIVIYCIDSDDEKGESVAVTERRRGGIAERSGGGDEVKKAALAADVGEARVQRKKGDVVEA